jgi:hypothetical protein
VAAVSSAKQNLTISVSPTTIRRAKVLAAERNTSISGLIAEQLELLVGKEDSYQRARRQAETLLDQGFHLGGVITSKRDQWHER